MNLGLVTMLLPPAPACESVLPQTEQYVEAHEQLLGIIKQLSPENADDYWHPLDWVLATFVPPMRADIMRYYADDGPRLADMLSPRAVAKIDETILGTLQQLEAAA